MAWTAQVSDKSYKNGLLTVTVQYTNGTDTFTDVFNLSGGDVEGAKSQVRSRLAQLANSDTLAASIPIGFSNFAANPPTNTPAATFVAALRRFQSCKRAVDLGLMATSDQAYIDAQNAMTSSWNISFIDSV